MRSFIQKTKRSFQFELLERRDVLTPTATLLKDIRVGLNTSSPENITAAGNLLFFTADNGSNGRELWVSDGTESGTVITADLAVGTGSTSIFELIPLGEQVLFSRFTSETGTEIWVSDGTTPGTKLLKDINPGISGSSAGNFFQFKDKIYFSATDGANGFELWSTDGTTAGTTVVKDINAGNSSSSPEDFVDGGNRFFFTATTAANGTEIWVSDGTSAGTRLFADVKTGPSSTSISSFTPLGTGLVFVSSDSEFGTEIWFADGAGGATILKDIEPGTSGSFPAQLRQGGSFVFFEANTFDNGQELWRTDGTTAGTVLLADIRPGQSSSSIGNQLVINDVLFFTAFDGTTGTELWKSDGTPLGTIQVIDLASGPTSSSPSNFVNLGGVLHFTASTSASGTELFRSDGTQANTRVVKEIAAGNASSFPQDLLNANGLLYFTAQMSATGREVHFSNGAEAGTNLVTDVRPGTSSSGPASLTNVNGTLYFTANDGAHGVELWVVPSPDRPQVLTPIADRPATEDNLAAALADINLNNVFTDPNDSFGSLVFTFRATTATQVYTGSILPGQPINLGLPEHFNGSVNVTVRATDPSGQVGQTSFVMTVSAVNDGPSIVDTAGTGLAVNEGEVLSVAGVSIVDVDASDNANGIVRVTLDVSKGTYTLSQVAALTFQEGDGFDDSHTMFSGTLANVNAAIAGMTYRPTTGSIGADTLKIAVTDLGNTGSGGDQTATRDVPITVSTVPAEFLGFTGDNDRILTGVVVSEGAVGSVVLTNSGASATDDAVVVLDPLTGVEQASFKRNDFAEWTRSHDRLFLGNVDAPSSNQANAQADTGANELIQLRRSQVSGQTPTGDFLRILDAKTGIVRKSLSYSTIVTGSTSYATLLGEMVDPEDEVFVGRFTQTNNLEILFFNRTNQNDGVTSIVILDLVTGQETDRGVHNNVNFGGWIDPTDEYVVSDTNFDGLDDIVIINRVANPEAFRSTDKGFVGMVTFNERFGGRQGDNIGFYRFFNWNFAKPGENSVFPGYDELADRASFGKIINNSQTEAVITLINSSSSAQAAYALLRPAELVQGIPDSFQLVATIFHSSANQGSFNPDDKYVLGDVTGDGSDELISYSIKGNLLLRTFDALQGSIVGQLPASPSSRPLTVAVPTTSADLADAVFSGSVELEWPRDATRADELSPTSVDTALSERSRTRNSASGRLSRQTDDSIDL